jgi:hypothetical protein
MIILNLKKYILFYKKTKSGKFRRENIKLYVVFMLENKIESKHYYYTFKHLLPEHEFINKLHNLIENCELLFIDDLSLSGERIN